MSALAHFADSSRTSPEVREVPEPAVSNRSRAASLFDHLARECEYIRRNLQPERLGGFQVKNQLEFGRSHNWQVGRFLALENSPDIIACLMKGISQAGPIADKPPIFCCLPCCVTRGQSKARNFVDNDLSIGVQEWAGTHEELPLAGSRTRASTR
jgi:hypothetical protein